jgi:hypothetical protein
MALNPIGNPDWPKQTADAIDSFVSSVRDKGTSKIVLAARGLVFGLLAAMGGLVAFVLFMIGLTRGLQVVIAEPTNAQRAVYLSYLIVGTILVIVGLILMRKRHSNEVPQ